MSKHLFALLCCSLGWAVFVPLQAAPRELRAGDASHAFAGTNDLETVTASGANVLYVPGLGTLGREGLPDSDEWSRQRQAAVEYIHNARRHGAELVLGEVSATSFAGREGFDTAWPVDLRAQIPSAPMTWRQQDSLGKPLPSADRGRHEAACMNNPYWRAYIQFIVREQLEAGCDGIFFNDLAVHPQGCYCRYCMDQFLQFLLSEDKRPFQKSSFNILHVELDTFPLAATRELALTRTNDFRRFRCAIAREFIADLRAYARTIKPTALVAADNGLRSPDGLFLQCRTEARSIPELSQAEDFVVVEDTSNLPRLLPGGETIEYSPTYKQLNALSHGKPLVASLLAAPRATTPPDLMRLAMAEAVACNASYLGRPFWPEKERAEAAATVRAQTDLLRRNDSLLNGSQGRRDAVLFLPFRQWLETDRCPVSDLAAALTRANVQYEVISEEDLQTGVEAQFLTRKFRLGGSAHPPGLRGTKVLAAESLSAFNPSELKMVERFISDGGKVVTADSSGWLMEVQHAIGVPSVVVEGPRTIRAFVRDQGDRTIIHLLNLNVQRLASGQDQVNAASDAHFTCRVPFERVQSVQVLTADPGTTWGTLPFSTRNEGGAHLVEFTFPRLEVAALVVIAP